MQHTNKGPYPITKPTPQHWTTIFTSRDEHISPIIQPYILAQLSLPLIKSRTREVERTDLRIEDEPQASYGLNTVRAVLEDYYPAVRM